MYPDLLAKTNEGMIQLLAQFGSVFQQLGARLFSAFAVILIAWFGIQIALSSGEGGGGMPFGQFIRLIMRLSISYTIITYYYLPIPGFGISFVDLVTEGAQGLVRELSVWRIQEVWKTLTDFEGSVPVPLLYAYSDESIQ